MSTPIPQYYNPGTLVSARGREWVVLPTPAEFSALPEFLYVKPLDGSDAEATGILASLEEVAPAKFALPDPKQVGNDRSCRYLRDALRFAVRNGAGPFRSFARFDFEPRPYQFAPLMLALKQSPTRLLVADDVGVGKTIETGMIVRELLDRGECRRFCVLCPPHLAEQWKRELYEKFQLDATVVLANTVRRLERDCAPGESLFQVHPYTIASIDYLKADAKRDEFLRAAPELIVIDEAHAVACEASSARRLRYELARKLCDDPNRHVVLVTATPHSGKSDAFRSLLGLLDRKFLDEERFPDDLSGDKNKKLRQELAQNFIQRRRADVARFLGDETPFPTCVTKDQEWTLSPRYKALFDRALKFARELVEDKSGTKRAQRVRWWSALSLMRSLASSPAAAEFTLRQRSGLAPDEDGGDLELALEQIDEIGRAQTLDADATDLESVVDTTLGADATSVVKPNDKDAEQKKKNDATRRTLNEMARQAAELRGPENDAKLVAVVKELKALIKDGFSPIVFCRFIPTVDYLKEALRDALDKSVVVEGVTGQLPSEERERRVLALADAKKRVLVCTDCLSEGINLQDLFNATVHYDLSWNPTRHEQREGRVDRYGQRSKEVRSTTFYGKDNGIDGLVLNILLRKHRDIKKSLGVSVPTPSNSEQLMEAIFNGFLVAGASSSKKRERSKSSGPLLPGIAEFYEEIQDEKLRAAAKEFHAAIDEKAAELRSALADEEELVQDA
ncbi:MAG: DEAD/DEAH box helicase, partial [Thermoguttaceae bacterium]|nr:DEAD/DEAH box helicase [Thermoguttaceae bacterium]